MKAESEGWAFVTYGDSGMGYVSAEYLFPVEEQSMPAAEEITIIDSEGNRFKLVGDYRVLRGSID